MNIFIIMLFLSLNFVSASSKFQHVLYNQDGNLVHGTVQTTKAAESNSIAIPVKFEKYISSINLSQRTQKITRADLIFEVDSISAQIQDGSKTLKKGMIVLNAEKKPALIEAVFPNGKVTLKNLDINSVSRFRLEQNKNFAPKRSNLEIVDASSIRAIEQKCFLGKYCKDSSFKEIEGIPLCANSALNKENGKGLVSCGKTNVAQIGAVFSDGTLLLQTKLINPFPKSTLKYYPDDSAAPTDK